MFLVRMNFCSLVFQNYFGWYISWFCKILNCFAQPVDALKATEVTTRTLLRKNGQAIYHSLDGWDKVSWIQCLMLDGKILLFNIFMAHLDHRQYWWVSFYGPSWPCCVHNQNESQTEITGKLKLYENKNMIWKKLNL